MTVKGSENYVWFTNLKLGSGYNGPCFKSRNKKTGEEYVVKELTFNLEVGMANKLVEIRHKNVLKMFGVEVDTKSPKNVLIVEFCDEKSLKDLLLIPDNVYGLNENLMIALYNDTVEGLQYLNREKLLPSNFHLKTTTILCTRNDDDSFVFKISDYCFYNFVDDMYGISALKNQLKSVPILLWSLGCLMCHAITGKSPFNGIDVSQISSLNLLKHRKNNDLYVVKNENSSYEWRNSFPSTCLISHPTQTIFQQFINNCFKTGNPLSHKDVLKTDFVGQKIEIFNANDCSRLTHYIVKANTINDLKSRIKFDKNCILVHKQTILDDTSKLNFSHGTLMDEPIVIINKDQDFRIPSAIIAELKSIHNALIQLAKINEDDMEKNIDIARKYSSFAIACLNFHSTLEGNRETLRKTLHTFKCLASEKYETLNLKYSFLVRKQRSLNINNNDVSSRMTDIEGCLKVLKRDVSYISTIIPTYSELDSTVCYENDAEDCRVKQCHGRINEFVQQTRKTYTRFLEDRDKVLNHNDKQILKYDRIKLNECAHKAFKIIYEHCVNNAESVQNAFKNWLNAYYNKLFGKQSSFVELEIKLDHLKSSLDKDDSSITHDSGYSSGSSDPLAPSSSLDQYILYGSRQIDERSPMLDEIMKIFKNKPNVQDIYDRIL